MDGHETIAVLGRDVWLVATPCSGTNADGEQNKREKPSRYQK